MLIYRMVLATILLPYRKPDKKTAFGKKTFFHTYTRCIVVFLVHCVLTITMNSFRYVFLAVGTIIALQFSESVFLECERDWFVKQSNERIPKKRWKFTYERSPVLTHRCMFTSFRIVFLYSFKTVFHRAQRVFLYKDIIIDKPVRKQFLKQLTTLFLGIKRKTKQYSL